MIPLGTLDDYWRGAKEGEPSGRGRTRSEVSEVCGKPVVWIEGCSGCVALTHVQEVTEDARG